MSKAPAPDDNEYFVNITMSGGTINGGYWHAAGSSVNINASAAGSLIAANIEMVNFGSYGSATLPFTVAHNGSAPYDLLVSGAVIDNAPNYVGTTLIKAGPGLMVMSGSNTYNGPTTVAAGTLAVNGQLTALPVGVSSGGVFSGTGTVGNLVQVAGGGALNPGFTAGAGTLNAAGVALAGGSILDYALVAPASNSNSFLNVTGTLTLPTVGVTTLERRWRRRAGRRNLSLDRLRLLERRRNRQL